jgi:hypothetical protein
MLTVTPTVPTSSAHIWKQLSDDRRVQAAEAFWTEEDGFEQQVEALGLLARRLKARPKFVAGLSVEKRARYLATYPGMPEPLAARLLVSYHLARHRPMLGTFLDALGISHENGLISQDPEAPPAAERVAAAVETLDAQFVPDDVTVYLATLLTQDPETWGALANVLEARTVTP